VYVCILVFQRSWAVILYGSVLFGMASFDEEAQSPLSDV